MSKKASPADKRRYWQLRDAGWSPEASAKSAGFSKSWAYNMERLRAIEQIPPVGIGHRRNDRAPAKNLSDAVAFLVALNKDDSDKALSILERFGVELIFSVSEVALYFARVQAMNQQQDMLEMFEEEPEHEEIAENPIGPQEILELIPASLDRHFRDEIPGPWDHVPARFRPLIEALEDRYPEMKEAADKAYAALYDDDSGK